MKKAIALVCAVVLCTGAFAQKTLTIENALAGAAKEIAESEAVKDGDKRLAVSNFKSDTKELSDYLQRILSDELAKNKSAYKFIERDTTVIDKEIDYQQFSGNIDERTIVNLGKRLGANVLVYGEFSQLTETPVLTVRAVSVESSGVLFIGQYNISDSPSLKKMLGDKKALNDAGDYMSLLGEYKRKMIQIEADKKTEVSIKTGKINQEYQEKINNIWENNPKPKRIKDSWDYEKKQSYINNEKTSLEESRDNEIKEVEEKCRHYYDELSERVKLQKDKILKTLKNESFILRGDNVRVAIGDYKIRLTSNQKNEDSQYFPIKVTATKGDFLKYEEMHKKRLNLETDEEEFLEIDEAREAKTYEGSVTYKLSQIPNDENSFSVRVTNVTVKNTRNGKLILTVNNLNKECGTISVETKKYSSSKDANLQKDFNRFKEISSSVVDKNENKTSSYSQENRDYQTEDNSNVIVERADISTSKSYSGSYYSSSYYNSSKNWDDLHFVGLRCGYVHSLDSVKGLDFGFNFIDWRPDILVLRVFDIEYINFKLIDSKNENFFLQKVCIRPILFGFNISERFSILPVAFGIGFNSNDGDSMRISFDYFLPIEFRISNRCFLFSEYNFSAVFNGDGSYDSFTHSFKGGLEVFLGSVS